MKIFWTLLLLTLFACIKEQVEIDVLKNGTNENMIVIDGFATTYFGNQYLQITELSELKNDFTLAILNAKVRVYSKGVEYDYELMDSTGIYYSIEPYAIEKGVKYTCEVLVDNHLYLASDSLPVQTSNLDTLLPQPMIEEINKKYLNVNYMEHYFGYDNTSLKLLNYDYNGTDTDDAMDVVKYIFETKSSIIYQHKGSLPQGLFSNGTTLHGFDTKRTKETNIEYFHLDVSEEYGGFLTEYFNITEWSDGIFATIPGNATTNVSEGGTGYFFLADVKRIQISYEDYFNFIE